MKFVLLVFLIITNPASPRRISKTSCGSSATFYRVGAANQVSLHVPTLAQLIVASLDECIDSCVDEELCNAFNYRCQEEYRCDCHLLKEDHMILPSDIQDYDGWNLYATGSLALSRAVGSRCKSMIRNPCPLHCSCVDTCESYRCDCTETERLNIFTSCKEALLKNPASPNHWIMHKNMTKAVLVECKTIGHTVYALLGHNSEAKIAVKNFEAPASYKRSIKYGVNSFEDVSAFVDTSASCKQFIKLNCRDTLLFRGSHGYARNRHGQALSYMGGGPSDGSGCACGITHSCANSLYHCNCDANDGREVVDEGYFRKKSDLPITELRFGDTGFYPAEYVYHTLGKLMCIEN